MANWRGRAADLRLILWNGLFVSGGLGKACGAGRRLSCRENLFVG